MTRAPEVVVVVKATRHVTTKRRRELLGEALKSGMMTGYKLERNGGDGAKLVAREGACDVADRLESTVYRQTVMELTRIGFMAVVNDTEMEQERWIRMEPQEGWREKVVEELEEEGEAEAMEE